MVEKRETSTSLIQATKTLFNVVSSYQPKEMKKVFAKLAGLKEALKAADMFYEASVQFARLEAYALIRAVELSEGERPAFSGANKTLRAEAAVWLFNMTEIEREAVIERCVEGKTIAILYKELISPNDKERASSIKMQLGRNIALDLKRNGVAVVNTSANKRLIERLPINLRQDVTDGLRNLLLKKGAVGIGDREGTYVIPESNNKEVIKALETRLHSMQSDFLNFLAVARKCTKKPYFEMGLKKVNDGISIYELLLVLAAADNAIDLYVSEGAQEALKKKFLSIEESMTLKRTELEEPFLKGGIA